MENDVIIAGFGGQGVMLMGKMLAYGGMHEGKEVSWLPSYGPEMRGGTANCTVVISDEPVGSPVVACPKAVLALNLPSLDKFEPTVKSGGVLLINTSLINRKATRTDVIVVEVPANEIAVKLANPKGANMVILGAYLGASKALTLETISEIIRHTFADKPKSIEPNLQALAEGYALGEAAARSKGAAA
jgi:2-oxoglutarate ferredoxin oxidoreductase subunit gamma